MSRKFDIEWPEFNVTVTAELRDDENPELCDQFWQALPFDTVFMAAMSPGELFKVPIPFMPSTAPPEKLALLPDEPSGSVLATSGVCYLLVKYGVVVEPFRLPRIAWIPETELEKLRNLAITKLRDAYFFTKEVNIAKLRRQE